MDRRTGRVLVLCLASACAGGCLAQQPPAAGGAAAPAAGGVASADDLLNALERADQNLTSLKAQIRYDRTFELQGDRQIRLGDLYFVSTPKSGGGPGAAPDRKFAVSFEHLQVGDVVRTEPKIYIFD